MITCDKCGFGHKTFEEKRACKSWDEIAAELKVAPAATQEQPAGSGASEPSMIAFEKAWQQIKHQMEYEEETLRRVPNDWPLEKRTAYWMYLSADAEGWEAGKIACMAGSPRKVGEDGAPEKYERTHSRVWTNAWNAAIEECAKHLREGWSVANARRRQHQPSQLLHQNFHHVIAIVFVVGGSSSVPVGEQQKQEEGV